MHFEDTPVEAAFRTAVRQWLTENAPAHELSESDATDEAEQIRTGRAWLRCKAAAGFGGMLLPKSIGGREGTIAEAMIFAEEEARYRLPQGAYINIGLNMALPAIHKHGNAEQIQRFAGPTLKGDMLWCQLFSEPAAGSDLAAVRTRAARDGQDWVVNGQKLWSSWAHHADWGILLARTDPGLPKHRGLTFFVVDIKTPGIEIRPIRQISGLSDFNETFLTDVRIPDDCRIGQVGEGWSCAMTVLTGERLSQGGKKKRGIADLLQLAGETVTNDGRAIDDGAVKLTLAIAYAEEQAEGHLTARLRTMVERGENPGALAAIIKLAYANRLQKMSGFAMEFQAMAGLATAPDDALMQDIWQDYIWSAALRIAGGADEVLRNQISERLLGMPGEMRADKDIPFDQLGG